MRRDINVAYDSNYNKTLYDITIKSDLLVCYNCLTSLNYQNFKSFQHEKKRSYIRSFDIPQFLEYFRPFFFDLKYYRNNNIKTGNYTADH